MNILTLIASKILGLGDLSAILDETLRQQLTDLGYKFLIPIIQLIDTALVPIIIVILAAGTIYAVILGVNMARADSSEKRDEAKKRLINVIVGAGIIIVLLAIIYALASNIEGLLGLAQPTIDATT